MAVLHASAAAVREGAAVAADAAAAAEAAVAEAQAQAEASEGGEHEVAGGAGGLAAAAMAAAAAAAVAADAAAAAAAAVAGELLGGGLLELVHAVLRQALRQCLPLVSVCVCVCHVNGSVRARMHPAVAMCLWCCLCILHHAGTRSGVVPYTRVGLLCLLSCRGRLCGASAFLGKKHTQAHPLRPFA